MSENGLITLPSRPSLAAALAAVAKAATGA